jgi:hypothetical protein
MPFFVVGNVQRLGLIAKSWTLDAQVNRDSSVLRLNRLIDYYATRYEDRNSFLEKRINPLNVRYFFTQRKRISIRKFKKPVKEMTVDEKEAFDKWSLIDPWYRCWEAYIKNKYFDLRKYIATVGAKIRSLKFQLDELKL